MRIGVFSHGWWQAACDRLQQSTLGLPVPTHPSGNVHAAEVGPRLDLGEQLSQALARNPVDLLLDNGGTGLGFLRGTSPGADVRLLHESVGIPLCSHFIDPLVTAFQGLGWPTTWQCLTSSSWIKAVWDRAQVAELQQFGFPNVFHLPMAAPERDYDTTPLDPEIQEPVVSFVGSQNSTFFSSNAGVASGTLLPATLALSEHSGRERIRFFDAYYQTYGLGNLPTTEDNAETQIAKTAAYFDAKLFYNASLNIRHRDRFVIVLFRKLGDRFRLVGDGWDRAYGLPAASPLPTSDDYFNHFRNTAVNINLVNGNAETGLNMRHFEITAAGGFMLCHDQPELSEHFVVGKECVAFSNEADMIEKIEYYLAHPDERVAIALAGQRRSLAHHLYSHRLQTLLTAITPRPLPVEYSSGTWSEDCRSLLPKADVVLDCGANVGQMAQSLRHLYPAAQIHSFEPVSEVYEQLETVCRGIQAHPVKKAVGNRNGKAMINLTTSPEANSLLDYEEGNPCAKWTWVKGQEEVDLCTLDAWCQDNDIDASRVDFIKLDIQGAELQALHGAEKILKTAKLVYLETSFVPLYKESPLFPDIERFMTQHGYRRHAVYPSDQPHHWGDTLYVKT